MSDNISHIHRLTTSDVVTTFKATQRAVCSLKVCGFSPSEKLLLKALKESLLNEHGGVSDVTIFYKDIDGNRKSYSLDKRDRDKAL